MRSTVGIFTHETRTAELALTVEYLAEAGITPDVINTQTGVGSAFKNRLNAVTTLERVYDGRPVLLLEDDVLAGKHVKAWVEHLEYHARDVVSLLPMKPESYTEQTEVALRNPRKRKAKPSRLEVCPRLQHWWGSQAVWMPARFAERVLNDDRVKDEADNTLGPWDHTIRKLLMEHDEQLLVAFPAVFQHQSPPSVRQRQNKRQRLAAIFDPNAEPPSP